MQPSRTQFIYAELFFKRQKELAVLELSGNRAGIVVATNTIISTYAIVFVVESDENSFFSTIALVATPSPLGVIAGALACVLSYLKNGG
ncbi:BnaA09g11410D [Brassica napus]|uniref:(rape) hypothetical protein n=1 Tax=Brassica napus TaxID=3708 RepID=A0A078HA82_BRANA|nr:unnamed protein product [Brassica napus]CDY34399.1 BnaA09g11410D [Brassica napus]